MAISCDCCKKDLTPKNEEGRGRNLVSLNGHKVMLCGDCFITLSDFACSDEHLKATKEYLKEMEKF